MAKDALFVQGFCFCGEHGESGKTQLSSHSIRFFQDQSSQGRSLYLLAQAVPQRKRLKPLDLFDQDGSALNLEMTLVSGYGINSLYNLPNGSLGEIYEDYQRRRDFLDEKEKARLDKKIERRVQVLWREKEGASDEKRVAPQRAHNQYIQYWSSLLRSNDRKPFDEETRYKNPFGSKSSRDLFLAKRLVFPHEYQELRTVMVGTNIGIVTSDPETPLVLVSESNMLGNPDENWPKVPIIVDALFGESIKPWQVFDQMYGGANKRRDGLRIIELQGQTYVIERGEKNQRVVHWQDKKLVR